MIDCRGSEKPSEVVLTPWDAREQGKQARRARKASQANPYPRNSSLWMAWIEGYIWQKVHYS